MSTLDPPAGIISQQVFDQYSSKWVEIIGNPDTGLLNKCFWFNKKKQKQEQKLTCVTFPALQIARLVSTVGAKYIKARFLVATETQGELLFPHFTLALFAADDLTTRLSSYYLADKYWLATPTTGTGNEVIPTVLADYWLGKWSGKDEYSSEVKQTMFSSPYGFLRGYTFELDDFLKPLSKVTDLQNATLQISFGLHEFYHTSIDGTDALNYTLGLVVQYLDDMGDPIDDPSYDMSQPCPPKC